MIKRILLLAIVIGGGMTTVAQNSIDTLFMSVSQRLSGHPSELIYLQTGKDIYETGEDLWFKAYQLMPNRSRCRNKAKRSTCRCLMIRIVWFGPKSIP